MSRAMDVACFFIEASLNDYDDPATNIRIQKLLYFAQGWSLVKLGKPLFSEKIEAWEFGPVVKNVYKNLQTHGAGSIMNSGDFKLSKFKKEEINLLLDVFMKYRNDSTSRLASITHEYGSPWYKAYHGGAGNMHEISLDEMKKYFSGQDLEHFKLDKTKIPQYRKTEDGNPIFPLGTFND